MLLLSLLPQCIFFVEEDALLERGEKTLFHQQFPLLPFGKSDGLLACLGWGKEEIPQKGGRGGKKSLLPTARDTREELEREKKRKRGERETCGGGREREREREKCASCSVCGGGRE